MFNACKGETNIHAHIAVFFPQLQDILSGFDPRTFQPVASRYTDWAIPAPIC
jgi:hypothetical protein